MSNMKNGIMNFRGNEYYTVARRVADFRAAHPISQGWGIVTEPMESRTLEEKVVRFKATIIDPEGRIVATGYAEETRSNRGVNATSALENCETSSIGRALAAAGWVAGGQYASADEIIAATQAQRAPNPLISFHACGAPIPLESSDEKHPSWDGEARAFCAALDSSEIGLRYDLLAKFLEEVGLPRPSRISRRDRQELYRWLRRDGLDVIAAHFDGEA